MSIIKNFIIIIFVSFFLLVQTAQEVKKLVNIKTGKLMYKLIQGKVCFAQSAPVLQAPKSN